MTGFLVFWWVCVVDQRGKVKDAVQYWRYLMVWGQIKKDLRFQSMLIQMLAKRKMKEADDIFNLSASDQKQQRFLESLGQAVISFQQLENGLAKTVGDLCCSEDYEAGVIITAELSFKGLCNLASSMFRHRYQNEKQADAFDKILAQCFSIEAQRNQLLHSTYSFGDFLDPDPVFSREKFTAKYKKGKNHTHEAVTIDELSDFSESCTKAWCDMADFINQSKKR